MINLVDIWWHCLKGILRFEPHQMCWIEVNGCKYHYCDCGYKKPQRIKVFKR